MVVATDGKATFAIFSYTNLHNLTEAEPTVGFFGNREKFVNLNVSSLEATNLFRIDGMGLS